MHTLADVVGLTNSDAQTARMQVLLQKTWSGNDLNYLPNKNKENNDVDCLCLENGPCEF